MAHFPSRQVRQTAHFRSHPTDAYRAGRWRWYYDAIADWMIANPGGQIKDCAKHLNRHPQTISMIISSDIYKDYYIQRKHEWQERHDHAILSKTTAVAEKSLDLLLEQMEKRADKIPTKLIAEIATSALDRLGYAPKTTPSVEVNVNSGNDNRVVMVPISAAALEEARDAIRSVEQQRTVARREVLELEAEPKDEQATSDSAPDDIAL